MPTAAGNSDPGPAHRRDWLRPALLIVAAVTLWRVAGLAVAQTDLFVDESQYWLWGRSLDWGYYSKPPLIAWVIRAFTWAGGDSPFVIRLPGPLFHAATALILGVAAERWGMRAAFWTAVSYVTVPFAAVGSALISTDTIMAPFYALAVLYWLRLTETRRARHALLAGAAAGTGFLAKYAAVYFLGGAALAALLPALRIGWRNAALIAAAFLAVAMPNLAWNAANGFATVGHTMDNVGWIREEPSLVRLDPAGALRFLLSQLAVFGPVLFGGLVAAAVHPRDDRIRALALASIPIVLLVTAQALLSRAYANWAVAAYFAGSIAAVAVLVRRPALLRASLAVNLALTLALPVATAVAPSFEVGGKPVLSRYLGRADLSRQIIGQAGFQGAKIVVASDRDVLADLFYTGRDSGLAFRALPTGRPPRNYYEQTYTLGPGDSGLVLAVLARPPACAGGVRPPLARLDVANGAYAGKPLAVYLVGVNCLLPDA